MRAFLALLAALVLLATPAGAQVQNWWGGSASGTGYPNNSTPITASATGTTGAISATLPGVAGKVTFICGFTFTSGGTTTALVTTATITGTIGGTLSYIYVFTTGSQGLFGIAFPVCIPASAMNTAIVVNQPAGGTGTVGAVSAWGYQL
jgi:hypothetical protein